MYVASLSRMVLENLGAARPLQTGFCDTFLFHCHADLVRDDVLQYKTKAVHIRSADCCCEEGIPLFQYRGIF